MMKSHPGFATLATMLSRSLRALYADRDWAGHLRFVRASYRPTWREPSGQALVEFALVMPVLTVVCAVLMQLGILFMVYLNLLHLTRDVTRWLVVHPDNTDAQVEAYIQANLPSGLVWSNFTFDFTSSDHGAWPWDPNCTSLNTSGECSDRSPGAQQRVGLVYDGSAHVILPT